MNDGRGRGKYDDELTQVRESVGANSALLIILDGDRGEGFSAQLHPLHIAAIPAMLRSVADQIEAENKQAWRRQLDACSWRCDVCTAKRPDAAISVLKAEITPDKLPAGTVTRNIKYCNDRPACLAGAESIKEQEERRL